MIDWLQSSYFCFICSALNIVCAIITTLNVRNSKGEIIKPYPMLKILMVLFIITAIGYGYGAYLMIQIENNTK